MRLSGLIVRAAVVAAGVGLGAGGVACFEAAEEPADAKPTRPANTEPGGIVVQPDGAIVLITELPDGAVIEEPVPADAGLDALAIPIPGIDAGKGFDFAPPYVAQLGPSSRSDAGHNFAANTPPSNPWQTRCIDCHKVGGTARPFFAAGSVHFRSDNKPAPQAEVRLKAYATSKAVSAYTDDDGNWFVPLEVAQDAGMQFSVRPGIRNASLVRTMGASPAIGRCNQCHGGSNYL